MKNLVFAGVATAALLALAPAASASDSFAPLAKPATTKLAGGVFEGRKGGHRPMPSVGHGPRPHAGGGHHRWGHRMQGRWFAGFYAPGGWGGYRAPFRGYVLPSYWVNPSYSINNYGVYGLNAPSNGYYWSRYYDDAVLRDQRGYVQDYRSGVDWDREEGAYAPPSGGYDRPDYGPAMGADRGVYDMDGPGMPTYSDEDGSRYDYDGQWTKGHYVDRDGRVYEGQWNGTVTRYDDGMGGHHPQGAGAPYPAGPEYAAPRGYERYEQCLKSNGITGAAIGAVIGAVAGNRIAGRGNRTEGSLIGGGLGALAGLGVEKSMKKCKKYMPRDDYDDGRTAYPGHGYPGPAHPPQGYYPGGYYYYYPQPVVTTITVSPAVTTTTTVTEEVYYETVAVKKRPAVRKWKPKPKPRCVCR